MPTSGQCTVAGVQEAEQGTARQESGRHPGNDCAQVRLERSRLAGGLGRQPVPASCHRAFRSSCRVVQVSALPATRLRNRWRHAPRVPRRRGRGGQGGQQRVDAADPQPRTLSQREHRDKPCKRHQVRVIEPRRRRLKRVRESHLRGALRAGGSRALDKPRSPCPQRLLVLRHAQTAANHPIIGGSGLRHEEPGPETRTPIAPARTTAAVRGLGQSRDQVGLRPKAKGGRR